MAGIELRTKMTKISYYAYIPFSHYDWLGGDACARIHILSMGRCKLSTKSVYEKKI
jgi:hypothetical protein